MVKAVGQGRFAVGSHSETGTVYLVDLIAITCDCLHHVHRGGFCKHLTEAKEFSAQEAAAKVKHVSDDQIASIYWKYQESRPDLAAVVLAEIEQRQEQVEREAEYRAIFS